MDFMFVFCIPWIVLSSVIRKDYFKNCCVLFSVVLFAWSAIASDDPEVLKEEYLIKSHKVIEAVPNILRRVQSSTSSWLSDAWDCTLVGACEDPVGYEAIRGLHRQLDDDANGSIDVSETDEFLRDELQYENGRHKERHKEFHGDDKYINVDELWQAWKISEVHNWTVEQTLEWLINQVDLPQYEHNFRNNAVNGASLPLLAQNTHNFISYNLGIKDSIHKQKIALKAMDVVLFGATKYHNYLKDALLALSLVIATGGCWFAYVQHKNSQTHMVKMMKDMEALQKAEDSLLDLQKELNKARHEQEIVSIEKQDLERRLQDEIITAKKCLEHTVTDGTDAGELSRLIELERELQLARSDLREAEKKLEARHWVAPTALQHWLQLTHELELKNYNAKKNIAEQQLQDAKEGCEKLSKKRATFMGAFRIAHGNSIDDVDDRIVKAKSALYEVTTDLQERMHRWKQIEVLCGVPIVLNSGLALLESILKPGKGNGTTGSVNSGLNTLTKNNSDTTLHEESPPPYAGIIPTPQTSIKKSDKHSMKGKKFLIHRDSGISLTSAVQGSSSYAASISKNAVQPCGAPGVPPPYSKTSPSFLKKNPDSAPSYSAVSRVVYPKECYRPPLNHLPSIDNEDASLATELEDDCSTERSITPPSLAASETGPATVFSLADGLGGDSPPPKIKDHDPQLITDHSSNGKMGDFVRKISAGILSSGDKKKKPGILTVEALRKSASSSNIIEGSEGGGASSESSSSVVSEEKSKKKKFFQTLRNRKPKS